MDPMMNVFPGTWTYRSWLNDSDLSKQPGDLLFGSGYIRIDADTALNELRGQIFGPKDATNPNPHDKPYSWQLALRGSINYGNPFTARFRGKGIVDGAEWIYDYVGYMVLPWPDGVQQVPSMVGTIVRVIPHPNGSGGVSPAGVVASWYAVRYEDG